MSPSPPIILFHYPFSPWSQKITAYLSLRGIPYTSCEQPVWMPRPDLKSLGVAYRRIPVLSIGRDFYCDTLLMLEKLESLYPVTDKAPRISADNSHDRALERLLEKWTDAVVFKYAAAAIPTSMEVITSKEFVDDRTQLWGRDWAKKHQDSLRPEGLVNLRSNFEFLENEVLADGREWIFKDSKSPSLSDIHAAWIFTWLASDIPGALPDELFGAKLYPKTHAWLGRYRSYVGNARKNMEQSGKVRNIEGKDAVEEITKGPYGDHEPKVDELDPSGLKQGEFVRGYPTDTGFTHKDTGKLVGLSIQEAVIESKAHNGTAIRVHHPRWNFAVEKNDANGA